MKVKTIAALTLAAGFLVIVFQNTEVTTLRFFFWKASMSQIVLFPLTAAIGFILGFLVAKLKR
ncbi:MAG: LapA family protein [Acidobacteria bacterium]|nr:LapA family protein [Acidobacteriota bacterium]